MKIVNCTIYKMCSLLTDLNVAFLVYGNAAAYGIMIQAMVFNSNIVQL